MILATPRGPVGITKANPFASGFTTTSALAGPGRAELVGPNLWATYAGLYRTQPWLHAGVNKIARSAARLPWHTFVRSGDERQRTRDHPIAKMLDRPRDRMSPFRFKEWLFGELALYGNFVARIMFDRNGGLPSELWPVPWPLLEIQGRNIPEKYVFHSPLGPMSFLPEQALHVRFYSPVEHLNPLFGTSPVEPLRKTLANEDAAARWSGALFRNAARPSGMVTTDKTIPQKDRTLLRRELQELYGGVDNAFRIALMDRGLDWKSVAMSADDSGLIELRKLDREEVCGVLDIPPPLLGILDRATFSNIVEQRRMWYQDSLGMWTVLAEEEMQVQVIEPAGFTEIFNEFEFGDVLRGTPKERAETYREFRRFYTIDEIRRLENLPPLAIPGVSDSVWMPINEFPVAQGMPEERPQQLAVLMAALERVERRGASRLGAGKTDWFDPIEFAHDLCKNLGRNDDIALTWAIKVGRAVAESVDQASTPTELRHHLTVLRQTLTAPEEGEQSA